MNEKKTNESDVSRVELQRLKYRKEYIKSLIIFSLFALMMSVSIIYSNQQFAAVDLSNKPQPDVVYQTHSVTTHHDKTDVKSDVKSIEHKGKLFLPNKGQGLYSWAIENGTTVDALYQLNPGLTAQNWDQFVGHDLRIN